MNCIFRHLPKFLLLSVALLIGGCSREPSRTIESPRPVVVVELQRTDPAVPLRLTGEAKNDREGSHGASGRGSSSSQKSRLSVNTAVWVSSRWDSGRNMTLFHSMGERR